MWERSQSEANTSYTRAAFPRSLMLPGPIMALDPCSCTWAREGGEAAMKTGGFHPESRQNYSFGGTTWK